MTDDIVARLRQPIVVDVHPVSLRAKTMREAADEIERLRADCAKLETAHGQNMREIDRLRAELAVERERADAHYRALERVSAKRDALRGLLREAREAMDGAYDTLPERNDEDTRLLNRLLNAIARIDAALKGDDRE